MHLEKQIVARLWRSWVAINSLGKHLLTVCWPKLLPLLHMCDKAPFFSYRSRMSLVSKIEVQGEDFWLQRSGVEWIFSNVLLQHIAKMLAEYLHAVTKLEWGFPLCFPRCTLPCSQLLGLAPLYPKKFQKIGLRIQEREQICLRLTHVKTSYVNKV